EQIKGVYKNEKLWLFSLFYFVTFGSFVAFTVFLPSFLVDFYALDKVDAGMRTAGFIALATLIRPVGGWLADKFQPLLILMGGLVGFFPPLLLSAIFSITGSYSIGFMAFSQFALVSLLLVLWMYYMDRINLSQDVFNSANQGIIVTDQTGKIVSVNNAFVKIT